MSFKLSDGPLRRLFGRSQLEAQIMVEPSPAQVVKPPTRNASELLDAALGGALRDLGKASQARGRAGIAVGVAGRTYPSIYHSAVDCVRADLEMQREICGDRIRLAETGSRSFGAGENESKIDADRAAYSEIDGRIAVIESLGVPLAWRAHLLDLLALAEADVERCKVAHSATLERYRWAREPTDDDDFPSWNEAAKKREAINAEDDARRALRAAENDLTDARIAVQRWRVTNARIAASIGEEASQ